MRHEPKSHGRFRYLALKREKAKKGVNDARKAIHHKGYKGELKTIVKL